MLKFIKLILDNNQLKKIKVVIGSLFLAFLLIYNNTKSSSIQIDNQPNKQIEKQKSNDDWYENMQNKISNNNREGFVANCQGSKRRLNILSNVTRDLAMAIPAIVLGVTKNICAYNLYTASVFVVAGLVESLKITIKKTRPDGTSTTSFPSGHTALGFIGAITIHRMYGVLFASPLYFFATTSAFARVKMNKHDDIDIIGGIAVSILSYWLVNYLYIRIREIVLNKIS